MVEFEFSGDKLAVDFQDLKPNFLSLSFHVVGVRPEQSLLEHLFSQDFIHVFAQTYEVSQSAVRVDKSDRQSKNLGCV